MKKACEVALRSYQVLSTIAAPTKIQAEKSIELYNREASAAPNVASMKPPRMISGVKCQQIVSDMLQGSSSIVTNMPISHLTLEHIPMIHIGDKEHKANCVLTVTRLEAHQNSSQTRMFLESLLSNRCSIDVYKTPHLNTFIARIGFFEPHHREMAVKELTSAAIPRQNVHKHPVRSITKAVFHSVENATKVLCIPHRTPEPLSRYPLFGLIWFDSCDDITAVKLKYIDVEKRIFANGSSKLEPLMTLTGGECLIPQHLHMILSQFKSIRNGCTIGPNHLVRPILSFSLSDHLAHWAMLGIPGGASPSRDPFACSRPKFFSVTFSQGPSFFDVGNLRRINSDIRRIFDKEATSWNRARLAELQDLAALASGKKLSRDPPLAALLETAVQEDEDVTRPFLGGDYRDVISVPPAMHIVVHLLRNVFSLMYEHVIPPNKEAHVEFTEHFTTMLKNIHDGKLSAAASSLRELTSRGASVTEPLLIKQLNLVPEACRPFVRSFSFATWFAQIAYCEDAKPKSMDLYTGIAFANWMNLRSLAAMKKKSKKSSPADARPTSNSNPAKSLHCAGLLTLIRFMRRVMLPLRLFLEEEGEQGFKKHKAISAAVRSTTNVQWEARQHESDRISHATLRNRFLRTPISKCIFKPFESLLFGACLDKWNHGRLIGELACFESKVFEGGAILLGAEQKSDSADSVCLYCLCGTCQIEKLTSSESFPCPLISDVMQLVKIAAVESFDRHRKTLMTTLATRRIEEVKVLRDSTKQPIWDSVIEELEGWKLVQHPPPSFPPPRPTIDLRGKKNDELKRICSELGISQNGTKAELSARIYRATHPIHDNLLFKNQFQRSFLENLCSVFEDSKNPGTFLLEDIYTIFDTLGVLFDSQEMFSHILDAKTLFGGEVSVGLLSVMLARKPLPDQVQTLTDRVFRFSNVEVLSIPQVTKIFSACKVLVDPALLSRFRVSGVTRSSLYPLILSLFVN